METNIERDNRRAACRRSLRTSWIAIASLAFTVLISGCQNSTDAKQDVSAVSTAPNSSAAMPRRAVSTPKDMVETYHVKDPRSTSTESNATTETLDTDAEQLETSRLLHEADRASSAFSVIGPHTKNVVDLYQFFEAAGWNDLIDGMTMKSCPDGYEFFCQTRGLFVEIYEKSGGDVDLLASLVRNIDLREHFYRLASAADSYQAQYQPAPDQASNK